MVQALLRVVAPSRLSPGHEPKTDRAASAGNETEPVQKTGLMTEREDLIPSLSANGGRTSNTRTLE